MRHWLALLLSLVSFGCFAQADYSREQRWADEITPAILVGDAVYLPQKSGHKFLAIHAPNASGSKSRAGVIVVHGMGVHPDWNLVNVLRSQLAEQGYATLSVQMPVLASDAKGEQYPALFPDAAERLQAAVTFLRDKGHRKIAIVSHSMGARMVNHFIAVGGASAFLSKHGRLDILCNNAGIALTPMERTKDGFESQLAANFLGFVKLASIMLWLK